MGLAGVLGSRIVDGQSVNLCFKPAPCHKTRPAKLHSNVTRRSYTLRTVAKAAAVDAPAKVASVGKPTNSKASPAKLTPEECSDIYRDMKLGREFEEM